MREVIAQLALSTTALIDALTRLGEAGLLDASLLPGWSRLTIACHLRYGARALAWVTDDAVAGRPTSFYPRGRAEQRPATLVPEPGESPADVVASLQDASAALHERWRGVTDWTVAVTEPDDNRDLGPVSLGRLALVRLTEVEVHGTDVAIGLGPWSHVFVREALPMRLYGRVTTSISRPPQRARRSRRTHPRMRRRQTTGTPHVGRERRRRRSAVPRAATAARRATTARGQQPSLRPTAPGGRRGRAHHAAAWRPRR
jgi:hypothetical protein